VRGSILRGGDFLQSDCGVIIKVIAAPQSMMKVTAHTTLALNRAAYHLGNRHVPLQIGDGWLLLEQDSVLKQMLLGLGVEVTDLQAPFEPESGAYGGGHHHANEHDETEHQHGHVHTHSHDHTH
jgi:urease accessory protein